MIIIQLNLQQKILDIQKQTFKTEEVGYKIKLGGCNVIEKDILHTVIFNYRNN